MCTFVVIASTYKLKISNFNLLASVAFFMLLSNTNVWKQLGFQLSFAAVWSIFAFQPILETANKYKNWFIRNLLKATALSVVAQFATFPLCLYYFGTFPSYFLIANLIAVPLSTFLTYVGVSAMILGNVPLIGYWLAKLLEKGIFIMNSFAQIISSLPYSTVQQLFISFSLAICLGLVIFMFSHLIKKLQPIRLKLFLFSLLLFSTVQILETYHQFNKSNYFIYSNSSKTQLVFIKGDQFVFINLWKQSKNKQLDNSILDLANRFNFSSSQIVSFDFNNSLPSKIYYFRYLRKCVLVS
jgi:competence protein ComEC